MTHNYTPNMLVKYIYSETDLFETLEIENAIENDDKLKESYLTLNNGYKKLPKAQFSPSKSAIDNILLFSRLSSMDALSH